MNRDLSNFRKVYTKDFLVEDNVPKEPFGLFEKWFLKADSIDDLEANAMTLATCDADGIVKSRVVLLKAYSTEGFVFYTNYLSEKGKAIAAHNKVSLSFFWPQLERQVIIQGQAAKTSKAVSDAYFASRPRESQLGACASAQSSSIENRNVLEQRLVALEEEFAGKEIKRPEHWGGFLVRPNSIEFWQGRPSRLHDRLRYKLTANSRWKLERLSP